MKLLDHARQGMQMLARGKAGMVWSGYGGSQSPGFRWMGLFPGATFDYERECGDPWRNSAVANCLAWVQKNFDEPTLRIVRKQDNGERTVLPNHALLKLLERPNEDYSGAQLWKVTLLSYFVDGNAYWMKHRGMGGAGKPAALHFVPHWQMYPQWPADGSQFISHYVYWVDGKVFRIDKRDVVHFRFSLDPRNHRLGIGPVKHALREIFSDNECSTYTAAILKNFGVPGLVLSPVDAMTEIPEEEQRSVKMQIEQSFTGDQRGMTLVPSYPVNVQHPGLSPEQMALEIIRNTPEERIAGAFGVPPIVAHLGAGLSRSTYTNYGQAVAQAYRDCLKPLQTEFARTLNYFLMPDLTKASNEVAEWDYTNVEVLQEARSEVFKRAVLALRSGLVTRDEARKEVGLPTQPIGDDWMTLPVAELVKLGLAPQGSNAMSGDSGVGTPGQTTPSGEEAINGRLNG